MVAHTRSPRTWKEKQEVQHELQGMLGYMVCALHASLDHRVRSCLEENKNNDDHNDKLESIPLF